ncbi:hypothetical protein [Chelativorans sp. YIM 93263]|uniref:hypothetical protein n=1 Tax=Chelativorans sp. YIM 93263 TaxID=2906648 RepID=UPI002379FDBD|nr:hypothetical protein [Chelativorans sp. YIM 93263]
MSEPMSVAKDSSAIKETAPEGPRTDNLLALLARIESAIQAETDGIRSDPAFDVANANMRKSRHLYELGRAFKGVKPDDLGADHRAAILQLRETLAANESTIEAHLSAVGEVATLLQDAIEQAQADGTYSAQEFGQG